MPVWAWVVLGVSVIITIPIFYNTIVTKKWRNLAQNEAGSWKLGVFYFNPKDPRIFLPKRTGLGLTINFANPWAVIIFVILIALIVAFGKIRPR